MPQEEKCLLLLLFKEGNQDNIIIIEHYKCYKFHTNCYPTFFRETSSNGHAI